MKEQKQKMLDFMEEQKPKALKLNLQFFSEDDSDKNPEADNSTGEDKTDKAEDNDKSDVDPEKKDKVADKTFSQDDLNRIGTKENRAGQLKILKELGIENVEDAKKGLEELNSWKESQKTEKEKLEGNLTNTQKENEQLKQQAAQLEAKVSAMSKDVQADSLDDVLVLAQSKVNEETDINAAIDAVLEQYPHFKKPEVTSEDKQEDKKKPAISTGNTQSSGSISEDEKWLQAFQPQTWGQQQK